MPSWSQNIYVGEVNSRMATTGFHVLVHLLPELGNGIGRIVRNRAITPGEDFHDVPFSLVLALEENVRRGEDEIQSPSDVPMCCEDFDEGPFFVGLDLVGDDHGFRGVIGDRGGCRSCHTQTEVEEEVKQRAQAVCSGHWGRRRWKFAVTARVSG